MSDTVQAAPGLEAKRWSVLIACIVCMLAVANLQYGWTQFTTPLTKSLHTSLAAVQTTFTLFVLAQTWLLPVYAYLMDRFGARLVVSVAGLLVGMSWIGAGMSTSLSSLYAFYTIGGVGVGAVYGSTIGLGLKWFPDRRGLTVGLVAGSYGFGAALTVIPIARMIASGGGYQSAFITFGIIQGAVVLLAAQALRMPPTGWLPAGWAATRAKIQQRVVQSSRDYTPLQMMKTAPFYVMYFMMTMVATGGLMVTAQLKPISNMYGHDKYILFGAVTVLSLALLLDGLVNGVIRPFWGFVSDRLGRYTTMAIAFTFEAIALLLLSLFLKNPIAFAILAPLTFVAWGEIYSIFPSAIADVFGSKFASSNYGVQYTSKGLASLLAAPGAALLFTLTKSWVPILWLAAGFDLLAAVLAVVWLRPLVVSLVGQQAIAAKVAAAHD